MPLTPVTVVTRTVKGSPLTYNEMDSNIADTAALANELIAEVDSKASSSEITSAVAAHVAQADPHTQYARESTLAPVAFSGDYDDLVNTPIIEGSLLQSVIIPNAGTMQWGKTNEFQATATVTIPLANSVDANTFIDIYVADKYAPLTVTINASGSDEFDDGATTDPQWIINFSTGGTVRVTSNGATGMRI
jgi:hypothetical protein